MKRFCAFFLCLLLVIVTLSSCTSKQPTVVDIPNITQALGPTDTPAPAIPQENKQSIFEQNPFDVDFSESDALSEEHFGESEELPALSSEPEATFYPYAGATPIPLDPIDMPTPTPRPALNFSYMTYSSATLGISFEGPAGWNVQEMSGLMILSEPDNQVKDGQGCIITVSAEPLTNNYSESNLKTHVKQRLSSLETDEFVKWENSLTASRHLMGSNGVYANYSGTLDTNVKVGGRILYASIDKTLYGLEIVYPYGFKDDFLEAYNKVRSTMKLAK